MRKHDWLKLRRWVGLALALFMVVRGLTGTAGIPGRT